MHADGAGGVALRQFDESTHGMVESFVARFPAEDPELLALAARSLARRMATAPS